MSSSSKAKRAQPDARDRQPSRMRQMPDDEAVVEALYRYGLLSQTQLERYLGRARSTVQRRLRRLYDHHYVERVFWPVTTFGSSPTLYVLGREGYALLASRGIEDFAGLPDKDIKLLFMKHTHAISEVHLLVEQACQQAGYTLAFWYNDNRLKGMSADGQPVTQTKGVHLVPDSYFAITVPGVGTTHCFLELDRGQMDLGKFRKKVEAYVVFYKSGAFQERFGAQGFRVLTVVEGVGERRVTNLIEAIGKVSGIGRRFWFTHFPRLTAETVLSAPIWDIAGSERGVALIPLG